MLHLEKLKTVLPESLYNELPEVCAKFGIDGPLRCSHFLGQAATESGKFTVFTENLNYSGEALWKLFAKYFKDKNEAFSFAKQPKKIANRIYSSRMGNGDEASGEGFLYKGRGALQTTGKNNYKALGDFLGVDLIAHPELVATDYILSSAAFFFMSNNLWTICDKGVDDATITTLSKRVNGGTHGLLDRIKYTKEYYKLLTT